MLILSSTALSLLPVRIATLPCIRSWQEAVGLKTNSTINVIDSLQMAHP
jgi:hypothetical protein